MPERTLSYETLNQKLDKGFHIKAPSWERLYIDSALAMTDQLAKLSTIESKERFSIKVTSESPSSLLVAWLNHVWELFENNKFLTKRIYFSSFNGKTIEATLLGEIYDPIRHGHITHLDRISEKDTQMGSLQSGDSGFFAKVFLSTK